MATYQGKPIRNSRPAQQGDKGFDQKKDQVVITLQDGSEQTVAADQVVQD